MLWELSAGQISLFLIFCWGLYKLYLSLVKLTKVYFNISNNIKQISEISKNHKSYDFKPELREIFYIIVQIFINNYLSSPHQPLLDQLKNYLKHSTEQNNKFYQNILHQQNYNKEPFNLNDITKPMELYPIKPATKIRCEKDYCLFCDGDPSVFQKFKELHINEEMKKINNLDKILLTKYSNCKRSDTEKELNDINLKTISDNDINITKVTI